MVAGQLSARPQAASSLSRGNPLRRGTRPRRDLLVPGLCLGTHFLEALPPGRSVLDGLNVREAEPRRVRSQAEPGNEVNALRHGKRPRGVEWSF